MKVEVYNWNSFSYNSSNSRKITIDHLNESKDIFISNIGDGYYKAVVSNESTASNIAFLKNIRKIFRKSHYCVGCKVCQANCKFGNLTFDTQGNLFISDSCKRCGQCLDIDTGCYVYKSLWLSKGLGNMNKVKSLDCYAGHAPKIEWFQQYVTLGARFRTDNKLGSNQVSMFNRFLRDSGIINGDEETTLGLKLRESNLEDPSLWALMLTNLSYTPEVGWFVQSFDFNEVIPQTAIVNKLSQEESVSASAIKVIPTALKRIAQLPLSVVGFGTSMKASKEMGGTTFLRTPWANPNPIVVLYCLYRFSEACGNYYQFTLSRLMNSTIESDGISPAKIFGLDQEIMTSILKGLTINYPEFISASFTHDLDNITLREDKSSADVLNLI